MADPRLMMQGAPAGMAPMLVQRPPTDDEKAEALVLRGLQIRTNAAGLAVQALAGERPSPDEVVALASAIASFITGP